MQRLSSDTLIPESICNLCIVASQLQFFNTTHFFNLKSAHKSGSRAWMVPKSHSVFLFSLKMETFRLKH